MSPVMMRIVAAGIVYVCVGRAAAIAQIPGVSVTQVPPPPDVAAAPARAERSVSGLAWNVLSRGTSHAHPSPNDRVLIDYTIWTG